MPFLVNAVLVLSLVSPQTQTDQNSASLTVFHANIDFKKKDHTKLTSYLNSQAFDVVFLQEVTPASLPLLVNGLPEYRLVVAELKTNSHGSAFFIPARSTLTILNHEIFSLDRFSKRPLLVVKIMFNDKPITLMSVHLTRPNHEISAAGHARELLGLSDWARENVETGNSILLIGDFNATPWSRQFRSMLRHGRLINSQQGYPFQMTWPNFAPLLFQIAIDHAFHSPDLLTTARTTGPDIGSDHLPIAISLAQKRQ